MIFKEGVTQAQNQALIDLNNDLKAINVDSGIFVTLQLFHGKVYRFINESEEKIYVGSSNLSNSGFYTNIEFNTQLKDSDSSDNVKRFLDYLFNIQDISAPLDNIKLIIKRKGIPRTSLGKTNLRDYKISKNQYPSAPYISTLNIQLRVDEQPMSSLNLYFEKGRKDINGKYTSRPWYEVEITSQKTDRVPDYPIGDFIAYYSDGKNYYKLPMITASANNKAITTKGNREILGQLIKGKLQRLNHLNVYEVITSDTLANYGRDYITLKKIKDGEYYLEF